MKSKLEQALFELEQQYKSKINYKRMAEMELTRLKNNAVSGVKKLSDALHQELKNSTIVLERMNRLSEVFEHGGYILIDQEADARAKIQSGFTALEEIYPFFGSIRASRDCIEPNLGEVVYKVSEIGMLEFYKAKRDSSD